MDNLLFRITTRQLRGLRVSAVALVAITAGLATVAHSRPSVPTLGYLLAFAVSLLLVLWVNVTSLRAFTECSPKGVRARGLFGTGIRSCPWAEVSDISLVSQRMTTMIIVIRRDGSRFRLGVPRDSPAMADRDLDAKFAQISGYWREAAVTRNR